MVAKIVFENESISNSQGVVTLTFTFDRIILHTVMHHSLTSTYMLNFIEIKETSLWVDGCTYVCMYIRTY